MLTANLIAPLVYSVPPLTFDDWYFETGSVFFVLTEGGARGGEKYGDDADLHGVPHGRFGEDDAFQADEEAAQWFHGGDRTTATAGAAVRSAMQMDMNHLSAISTIQKNQRQR